MMTIEELKSEIERMLVATKATLNDAEFGDMPEPRAKIEGGIDTMEWVLSLIAKP